MKEYRYFMRGDEERREFIQSVRDEMKREGVIFTYMNCLFYSMFDAVEWAESANYDMPVALPVGGDLVVVY